MTHRLGTEKGKEEKPGGGTGTSTPLSRPAVQRGGAWQWPSLVASLSVALGSQGGGSCCQPPFTQACSELAPGFPWRYAGPQSEGPLDLVVGGICTRSSIRGDITVEQLGGAACSARWESDNPVDCRVRIQSADRKRADCVLTASQVLVAGGCVSPAAALGARYAGGGLSVQASALTSPQLLSEAEALELGLVELRIDSVHQDPVLGTVESNSYCTGIVWDERRILTATHCFKHDERSDEEMTRDVRNVWVRYGGTEHLAKGAEPHMLYREDPALGVYRGVPDMMFLHLWRPLTLQGMSRAPQLPVLKGEDLVGKAIDCFGRRVNLDNPAGFSLFTKGSFPVTATFHWSLEIDNSGTERLVKGDSGGPCLTRNELGGYNGLVGVVSRRAATTDSAVYVARADCALGDIISLFRGFPAGEQKCGKPFWTSD